MYKIERISDDTLQRHTVTLPDGSEFIMTIYFVPMQLAWYITELSYGDIKINTTRISNSYNILMQFQNLIPFGIACISKNGRDPSLQEDFASGNSVLYLLSAEECVQYRNYLSGQK